MPRKRGDAPTEKELRYRELLAEQRASGLTLRAFARKQGMPETTLAWWKYTIAQRDGVRSKTSGSKATRSKTNGASVSLVPIKVVGSLSTATFVVQLRSGHSVRVERGFDAEELRRLVAALEASC